ncbi:predicted protein [Nematostella vectensis]|uniref:Major facilitator superfamily (MFS) profile domain-containing protein n=1 Tax=Nematostella vectensis TaxID=45351 RepID=A7SSW1_NEMVE|nr:major facilitator superfamily domain-containing protein 6 [Nematostella vectensis]EDO33207.1 predicted protein [Nematostella vectensis]|eukprot:XP_001625307.1 predicted protein [Nematostella vectensis]
MTRLVREQLPLREIPNTSLLHINPRTMKYKLFYFAFFFGSATIKTFLPVYFRFVGLGAVLTSVLTSVRPFTRLVSYPLFSGIADKTGKRKLILMASLIVSVLAYFSLSFVMIVQQVSHQGAFAYPNTTASDLSENTIFWTSLLLVGLGDFFSAPVTVIMSGTIIYWEGTSAFGKQRVFGALGFGLGSYLSGLAIDETSGFNYFHPSSPHALQSGTEKPNYLTAFFMFLVVNVFLIMLVKFQFELKTERRPKFVVGHLRILLRESAVLCFLGYIFVMGISGGVIMLFLFWFLEDLGASQALLGLASLVMSLSEIPVFPAASHLIKRYGHVGVLFLSLTCFIIRLVCYTFLHDPWYVLLIEPLHGITLAIMWSTCVSFASVVSPPEIYTSMEGVIAGVHYGLGWGLGVVIGGWFYHAYGVRNLFRFCLGLCCLCFPLLGVVYVKVKRDSTGNVVRYRTLDSLSHDQRIVTQEYQLITGNTYI